jgi:radical SAM/Cys-rich protein
MGVKQRTKSLQSRNSEFSQGLYQLKVLNNLEKNEHQFESFHDKIRSHGRSFIRPAQINTFQINIGKLCNQSCAHCHVDAGPDRKVENMDRSTLEKCLKIIEEHRFKTVDITGGAPEMNPNFRWFVESCAELGVHIINRCNLTIIRANKKYHDLPAFFAKHHVEIISSLPYFSKSRTDSQRGDGVFEDSIAALKSLNKVGYGMPGTGLQLNLVFNPTGAFLPGSQASLEAEFKRQLKRKFEIEFNQLFAITNLPVSRFLDYLIESGNYESYMEKLIGAFNPGTIDGLMCRDTLSISWDGYIYDCDFNQMLDLKADVEGVHIDQFDLNELLARNIVVNQHCFGCTAGSGSSCGGEIGA